MSAVRSRWIGTGVLAAFVLAAACGEKREAQEQAPAADRDLELAITRDTPKVALADEPKVEAPTPKPAAKPPAPKPAAPKPEPPPPVTATVAAGATFDVLVDDTISTKTHKPGDIFTAKMAADLRAADGTVLLPAGAELKGEITAVEQSTGAGKEALIGLSFQSVTVGKRTYPIRATVTAAEVESKRTTSDGAQAAKILGGAAAGAILGKVIGKDAKSTIIGAAAGAAAGTAIALGTADYAGVIPKGGKLTLKLEEPIEVVIG